MAIEKSLELGELATALAKAQATMEGAKKDAANPFFKSRYADLASVWEACREPLSSNNLSVVQTASGDLEGNVHVTTMLLHASGQWIQDTLTMKPKENTPQGIGSTITYARRYALSAMVGVAPEDDDGEAAQGRAASKTEAIRAKFVNPTPVVATPGKIVTPATADRVAPAIVNQ
jgi:hypothetical protein